MKIAQIVILAGFLASCASIRPMINGYEHGDLEQDQFTPEYTTADRISEVGTTVGNIAVGIPAVIGTIFIWGMTPRRY